MDSVLRRIVESDDVLQASYGVSLDVLRHEDSFAIRKCWQCLCIRQTHVVPMRVASAI